MHIKVNANKNKYTKRIVKKDTPHLQKELDNEINKQRRALRKKPLKSKNKEENKTKKLSTTDPEAGYYANLWCHEFNKSHCD
ncbi:hypothetical protein BUY37_08315 [Staphylococcus cohnii]|nr:hypothetical protein BUY38_06895 [Staphylococcus cohnii]PTF36284.1 hypothetical protein BUY25_04195 [Staphylococcus cohnii]RIL75256.1 hypothetical protein BUY37_08315 [Staphylococcus cohnii]RIL88272.1 hypothetical protein BUY32_11415 [Staphylococcus cohnii]